MGAIVQIKKLLKISYIDRSALTRDNLGVKWNFLKNNSKNKNIFSQNYPPRKNLEGVMEDICKSRVKLMMFKPELIQEANSYLF